MLDDWTKYLWDLRLLEHPRPRFHEIDITNKCNLNCEWCCNKTLIEKDSNHAALDDVLERVRAAIWDGVGVEFCGGGEPTLHPDFNYIMAQALPAVGIGLVSNGTNIPAIRYYLDITARHRNAWVRLSFNERPINKEIFDLFVDYPRRIGISIVTNNLDKIYPADRLASLAKLIRRKVPGIFTIPSVSMTPDKCTARHFDKVIEVDGTVAWCTLARGLAGKPPTSCPAACRWLCVDIPKAWRQNPCT